MSDPQPSTTFSIETILSDNGLMILVYGVSRSEFEARHADLPAGLKAGVVRLGNKSVPLPAKAAEAVRDPKIPVTAALADLSAGYEIAAGE